VPPHVPGEVSWWVAGERERVARESSEWVRTLRLVYIATWLLGEEATAMVLGSVSNPTEVAARLRARGVAILCQAHLVRAARGSDHADDDGDGSWDSFEPLTRYLAMEPRVHTVFHFGDEFGEGNLTGVRVVREFLRPAAWLAANPHVLTVPLGPYFPLQHLGGISPTPASEARAYGWFFAGDANKPDCADELVSRCGMAQHMTRHAPDGLFFVHDGGFRGSILADRDFRRYLCSSYFALVPRGFRSVESFRLFEAIECGAIPVVLAQDEPHYRSLSRGMWGEHDGSLGGVLWVASWRDAADKINALVAAERLARALGEPGSLGAWSAAVQRLWAEWRRAAGREVRRFVWGAEEVGQTHWADALEAEPFQELAAVFGAFV
jgi:Exostosin family